MQKLTKWPTMCEFASVIAYLPKMHILVIGLLKPINCLCLERLKTVISNFKTLKNNLQEKSPVTWSGAMNQANGSIGQMHFSFGIGGNRVYSTQMFNEIEPPTSSVMSGFLQAAQHHYSSPSTWIFLFNYLKVHRFPHWWKVIIIKMA